MANALISEPAPRGAAFARRLRTAPGGETDREPLSRTVSHVIPSGVVDGGLLIREARLRAGLTQRELATRLGTSHAAIARWENGAVRPSWDSVLAAVRRAGLDVDVRLVLPDHDGIALARGRLARQPSERLADLVAMANFIERGRGSAHIG